MGDFFHGWRRKTGVASLVMALVLMAVWLRGLGFRDELTFGRDENRPKDEYAFHQLILGDGVKLRRFEVTNANVGLRDGWKTYPTRENDYFFSTGKSVQQWQSCGFGFEERRAANNHVRLSVWVVPYWSIVVPLTMLSAYLMLTKPRKQEKVATTQT